ncbi:MAG TPA: hypothetical protein VJ521_13280 [Acidobacteriota bacterium]|nr:hypothetical protein [Acidobacteriota bacterium]
MMTKVMSLEFQKHKKAFFSVLSIIALGIFAATLIASNVSRLSIREGLVGAGVFSICMLPLVAVIFGVQSATSLRREAEKSHEEVFPVRPGIRVAGAYLASLIYFSAITLLVLGLLGYGEVYEVVYAWIGLPIYYPGLGFLLLLQTHFLAFAFTYWLRLPLLAGGVALILQSLDAFVKSVLISVNKSFYFPISGLFTDTTINSWLFGATVFAWGAGMVAIFSFATRLERGARLRFSRASAMVLCLINGPILSALILSQIIAQMNTELELYGYSFWSLYWDYIAKNLPGNF